MCDRKGRFDCISGYDCGIADGKRIYLLDNMSDWYPGQPDSDTGGKDQEDVDEEHSILARILVVVLEGAGLILGLNGERRPDIQLGKASPASVITCNFTIDLPASIL